MKSRQKTNNMKKYYQLILVIVSCVSVVTLLIYRHEYYRLRYVLEVLNFFGKPGLSEVEFCGPGFNATLLTEVIRNSSLEVRETAPLFQQIDENYYTFSAFLRSHQKYDSLQLSSAHIIDTIVVSKSKKNPNFRCNIWLDNNDKPKTGKFSYKLVSEVDSQQAYIFQCAMEKDIGKPIGVSFYLNDINISPHEAPIIKVIQVETLRKSSMKSNLKFLNNMSPTICVIPNRIPIVTRNAFIEFLVFHHMMGVNLFTIYDSMISEDIIHRLNLIPHDITTWKIQFFPLNFPFIFSKSYNIVRKAIELDCAYRNMKIDKEETKKFSHITVLSWDEFLVPRLHKNLPGVLNDFDITRKKKVIEVKPLLFCLNQEDDTDTELGHPSIMRKTHYFNINQDQKPAYIINLDTITSFEEIALNKTTNKISVEFLAIQKYSFCRDDKVHKSEPYDSNQMQVFQHKFEGAMLKFDSDLTSNTVYRLYQSGKIWEKTNEVRDML